MLSPALLQLQDPDEGDLCAYVGEDGKKLGDREVRETVSSRDSLRSWSSNITPVPHCPRPSYWTHYESHRIRT